MVEQASQSQECPPVSKDEFEAAEEEAEFQNLLTNWEFDALPFEDFLDADADPAEEEPLPPLYASQFTEFAFRMPRVDGLGYAPFSFKARRHMRHLYDTGVKRIHLSCGRQVEKCQSLVSEVSLANGRRVTAKEICVGNRVICLDVLQGGTQFTTGKISWVSQVLNKPGVRITTRQGHKLEVATTHPIRTWDDWTPAEKIEKGTRVATVRKAGNFGVFQVDTRRVELLAFMLGNGGTTQPTYTFTQASGAATQRFEQLVQSIGGTWRLVKRGKSNIHQYFLHKSPQYKWLEEDGCVGKYSYEKEIPAWVFDLSRENTVLFLNRLWATDGSSKKVRSSYSIEYCSTSRALAYAVQALLWKFGVPSSIRKNYPSYICTDGTPARVAYILRVETVAGVRIFLTEIGALGKSEGIPLPTSRENNNRDTFPIGVNKLLREIIATNPRKRIGSNAKVGSLKSAGLRETLKYPPTAGKLQEYVVFFKKDSAYDQKLVGKLEDQLSTEVYWDEVESVEHIENLPCVDFEVEVHHNFVSDGVVTHNSTFLGNVILANSCIIPAYKSLYVSPSSTQTRTFSNDRIKEPIETSPILRAFTTSMLSQNIMEKQFVNRSKITMRYAFLNADRCRGVPTHLLALDELQDLLSDNIPVIEQCLIHAPERLKRSLYSGTPKGLDNPIEYYRSGTTKDGRSMSTMAEWFVPCDCKGGEGGRYWNILGEKNIGKKGLICERCGKLIDFNHKDSQWARQIKNGVFDSFRIPQLMVPWRSWDDILLDYSRYGRDRFYNEVLGLSYDSGSRPLTSGQLQACCNPQVTMHPTALEALRKALATEKQIFAGVDYGTGENSYTVACMGYYVGKIFRIFWMHRFIGEDTDPQIQVEKLIKIFKAYGVRIIGSDYGGGFSSNNILVRAFGPKRLQKFQYMARVRRKCYLEPKLQRWLVHRTEIMSDIMGAIKRKQIEFMRWEEFREPFAADMMNIFSEYNNQLRMIQYQHRPDKPDDSFHSVLYCMLASMIIFPRPDIIAPQREFENQGPNFGGYNGPLDQGSY